MPRKKIPRRLAPLPKAPALRHEEHKTQRLLALLRDIALSSRGAESQFFYPMREVAVRFKVPVSLVAKAYRELEREGILKRVRGSGTVLQGLSARRKITVREVITIASSLSCFLTLLDYRAFLMQIRRELRKRDFAAAEVFFENGESAETLLERFKDCHPDRVLWYCPDQLSRDLALRLRDLGIPVIGISDGGHPGIRCQYEIDRQPAITKIASEWKKQAIRLVKVGLSAKRSMADGEKVGFTLRELGFKVELIALGFEDVEQSSKFLNDQANSATVLLHSAASLLALGAPEALAKLANHRLALIDGPISLPLAHAREILVDLVVVDWEAIARQIVEDLAAHQLPEQAHPVVFPASALLQGPLSEYAERP